MTDKRQTHISVFFLLQKRPNKWGPPGFVKIPSIIPQLSCRGRRSQGGFSLNSLDYGVFAAFKYEINMSVGVNIQVYSLNKRGKKKRSPRRLIKHGFFSIYVH